MLKPGERSPQYLLCSAGALIRAAVPDVFHPANRRRLFQPLYAAGPVTLQGIGSARHRNVARHQIYVSFMWMYGSYGHGLLLQGTAALSRFHEVSETAG